MNLKFQYLLKSRLRMKFRTTTVEDTEMIYSLLREKYPNRQVDVEFNYNTKEYTLCVTNKSFKEDPEVPLDLNIEVIYGDSVTGDTPILLRKDNKIYIETIQSIFNENNKFEYPGFKLFDKSIRLEKEFSLTDYQVWSDIGWININKVIRHKCDKKIYRILTHSGCVDVTEDHSLIKEDGTIIKPYECNLETKLLTNYPQPFEHTEYNNISKDRAYIYGFFYGDGSSDRYECPTGVKYSWTLNNSDLNVLEHLKQLLIKEYPNHTPIIYDTIKSSKVYKLTINNQKDFVEEYRQNFYDSCKYKKVPTDILNSSNEVIQSFFDGYWAADGCRKDKEKIGCTRFDNKGKIGSAGLHYLVRKLGYNVSLNIRHDKENIIRQTITNKNPRKESNLIKKIQVVEAVDNFVYDIETECGRFQAGIGNIIVKNTDSIMVRFKYNRDDYEKNRVDTFNMAILCGDKLTNEVFKRPPIEMEFEKVFQPFVLLTKKRYIAHKYDNTKDPFQLKGVDAKGIALTRRDYCKMVKNCYREVIDAIMDIKKLNGLQDSIEIFKTYIKKIDKYEVEIEDLIVSAMLAKSYKTKPVHVILAEKLKERKCQIQVGDRIPYIFIESDDPKKQKSELGEDPKYAIEHNLKFNRKCYLEQLAKPLLSFYKVVLRDKKELFVEALDFVNSYLQSYNSKKLKESDFKMDD